MNDVLIYYSLYLYYTIFYIMSEFMQLPFLLFILLIFQGKNVKHGVIACTMLSA